MSTHSNRTHRRDHKSRPAPGMSGSRNKRPTQIPGPTSTADEPSSPTPGPSRPSSAMQGPSNIPGRTLKAKKRMNGLASAARRTAPVTEDRPSSTHSSGAPSRVRGNQAVAENRLAANNDSRRGPNTEKHAKTERKPRVDGNGQDKEATYVGEIAVAEYERMKRENETMKKQLKDSNKTVQKYAKEIESLKTEALEQSNELTRIKTKSKENEQLLSTFETNLACAICMEVLLKPYALPPCGHVYCYSCLHDWFQHAPADPNDMEDEDEDEEDRILRRRKTCPTCRCNVIGRPVPLFVVKALASVFAKSRVIPGLPAPETTPEPTSDDPWQGLFYPVGVYESEDDDEEEDQSDSEDSDEEEDSEMSADSDASGEEQNLVAEAEEDDDWESEYGYGTGSDESAYEGEYVPAHWAPPAVWIDPAVYALAAMSDNEVALLRRGVSLAMIVAYDMRYSHEEGIVAVLNSGNPVGGGPRGRRHVVYLGWNISLHPGDPIGHQYMAWVRDDIAERPERWDTTRRPGPENLTVSQRLVRAEDEMEFDTSDTEMYVNEEADVD